jgi:hypothetical protein
MEAGGGATETQGGNAADKTAVKQLLESGAGEKIDHLETPAELASEEKRRELKLKDKYGNTLLWLLGAQLFVANAVFVAYAWVGTKPAWHIDADVMKVWLGATVVQVVGVAQVVTRNLFPRRDK